MTLLATVAFAAPPTGVDPEDLTRWESGRAALLAGPPGCWDLSGTLSITIASYTPATPVTRGGKETKQIVGSFSGRLDSGTWTKLEYDLHPAESPADPAKMDLGVIPLVGRIDPAIARRTNPPPKDEGVSVDTAGGEAINAIDKVLDELHPDATTAYGEWREDARAVALIEDVPLSKKAHSDLVTLTTLFPEGGPPTSLDAAFPPRIDVGEGLIRARVLNGQAHYRAQPVGDVVLPALDSLSFVGGALGFTIGYEQELTYTRAAACSPP